MFDLHLLEFEFNYAWSKSLESSLSYVNWVEKVERSHSTFVWGYPHTQRKNLSNKRKMFIGFTKIQRKQTRKMTGIAVSNKTFIYIFLA